jgi:hypothetical protein
LNININIQNELHIQGYFGVKITPLGSNLALLEGHEEGEVKTLMKEAKEWLKQWFREIRPWSTKKQKMQCFYNLFLCRKKM